MARPASVVALLASSGLPPLLELWRERRRGVAMLLCTKYCAIGLAYEFRVHEFLCVGNAKKAMAKIADPARANNVMVAEAETALRAAGFKLDVGKGSHRVWRYSDGRKVVIACHSDKLPS